MRESISPHHSFICKKCKQIFSAQESINYIFGKGITFPNGDLSVTRAHCPKCSHVGDYLQNEILKPLEQLDKENEIKSKKLDTNFEGSIVRLESKIEGLISEIKDRDQIIKSKEIQIEELLKANNKLADAVAKLTEKIDTMGISTKTESDKNPLST